MRTYSSNGWIHNSELLRVAAVLHEVSSTEHTRWLRRPGTKYLNLRIDARTGDFCVIDNAGDKLTTEELLELYPELRHSDQKMPTLVELLVDAHHEARMLQEEPVNPESLNEQPKNLIERSLRRAIEMLAGSSRGWTHHMLAKPPVVKSAGL